MYLLQAAVTSVSLLKQHTHQFSCSEHRYLYYSQLWSVLKHPAFIYPGQWNKCLSVMKWKKKERSECWVNLRGLHPTLHVFGSRTSFIQKWPDGFSTSWYPMQHSDSTGRVWMWPKWHYMILVGVEDVFTSRSHFDLSVPADLIVPVWPHCTCWLLSSLCNKAHIISMYFWTWHWVPWTQVPFSSHQI